MKYLLDSDRVVDYLKGRPDAVELVDNISTEGLSISTITYGKILARISGLRLRQ